jgi:FkbM family methyltransferase
VLKTNIRRLLPDSFNQRLSRAVWKQLSPSWKLPSGLVAEVKSGAEWVVYNDIFVDGEYDISISDLLNGSEDSPLIVDLGANIGYFALRFVDRWIMNKGSRSEFILVGVEGCPSTYSELLKRMNQPLLSERCSFRMGLVGKRTGVGYISNIPFHVGNSVTTEPSRLGLEVPFIDLDSFVPVDKRIALLKCDIEGSEEVFVENYPELLRRVDLAIFELHPDKCDTERCIELLNVAGLSHHKNVRKGSGFTVDLFARAH